MLPQIIFKSIVIWYIYIVNFTFRMKVKHAANQFKEHFMKLLIFVLITLASSIFFNNQTLAQSTCNFCGGTGSVACISCGGAGTYTCNQCGGAGGKWENCNCNNGVVTMPDGTQQVCNYCSGEGRKWHSCYNPNCNGGTVHCNFCGGSGNKTCGTCGGDGVQ